MTAFMGHTPDHRVGRRVPRSAPSGIWVSLRRPLAAGLLALLLAGCSAPAATPATHTIGGTISLSSNTESAGAPAPTFTHKDPDKVCAATGGYSDIREGAAVVVKNESGTVIATGSLGPGQYLAPKVCTFAFAVRVPDAAFYSVEVSHRGALTYSAADMAARGWSVALTLG